MPSAILRRLSVLLALSLLVLLGQGCADAPSHTLQIDFSRAPDVLAGAQVFIDGEAAGTLQPQGDVTLNSFQVTAGDHSVELRKEGYESQAFEVVAASEGGTTTLKADAATWFTDGQLKNALTLSW